MYILEMQQDDRTFTETFNRCVMFSVITFLQILYITFILLSKIRKIRLFNHVKK